MRWWVVRARYTCGTGHWGECRRSFTDEAAARAFMADPAALGRLCTGDPPQAVDWELTLCDPAVEPWIFVPPLGPYPVPGEPSWLPGLGRWGRAVLDHYLRRCDSAVAHGPDGQKEEGPLTPALCGRLRRRKWFGMQLYKEDRTLFHLDDGCEALIVATAEDLRQLCELGLRPEQFFALRPGDRLPKAPPQWRGG